MDKSAVPWCRTRGRKSLWSPLAAEEERGLGDLSSWQGVRDRTVTFTGASSEGAPAPEGAQNCPPPCPAHLVLSRPQAPHVLLWSYQQRHALTSYIPVQRPPVPKESGGATWRPTGSPAGTALGRRIPEASRDAALTSQAWLLPCEGSEAFSLRDCPSVHMPGCVWVCAQGPAAQKQVAWTCHLKRAAGRDISAGGACLVWAEQCCLF